MMVCVGPPDHPHPSIDVRCLGIHINWLYHIAFALYANLLH